MSATDRILTIAITATLTSAVWIVIGGSLIENATGASQQELTRPAQAVPSPETRLSKNDLAKTNDLTKTSGKADPPSLDSGNVRAPDIKEGQDLIIPVLNIRPTDLTDTFVYDEQVQGGRLHEAIDIMAPEGTTVVAAAPGTIEKLFLSQPGGNMIFVRSVDRETVYYYAHLAQYAEGLREGQRVRRGQRIGTVGSTGNAHPDAPHLHFAMSRTTADAQWWEPGNMINPYPLLIQQPDGD